MTNTKITKANIRPPDNDSLRGSHWRHKKRGSIYRVIFDQVTLQCSTFDKVESFFEGDHWIVYQSAATGNI